MAHWPDSAQLAQSQDVEPGEARDAWEWRLSRVMAAAIERVKADVGYWVEGVDEPDDALAEAALVLADLLSAKGLTVDQAQRDPKYLLLMKGHRRAWGFS